MEKNSVSEHTISLTSRKNMSLTGVADVSEFSDSRVLLKTTMGNLCVRGKNISINQLNTDTGTLEVNGEINTIQYTSGGGDGFLTGLFK